MNGPTLVTAPAGCGVAGPALPALRDLANLAQLNEVVIQRMQSGVLACDQDGRVRMMNKMARTFLGVKTIPAGMPPSRICRRNCPASSAAGRGGSPAAGAA